MRFVCGGRHEVRLGGCRGRVTHTFMGVTVAHGGSRWLGRPGGSFQWIFETDSGMNELK